MKHSALLAVLVGVATGQVDDDAALLQRQQEAASAEGYAWPSGRGRVGSYSRSQYRAPRELSDKTLAWSWNHPDGRWSTIPVGTAIDDKRNVFVTFADGLRKFSPKGHVEWHNDIRAGHRCEIVDAASLWNGGMYAVTTDGRAIGVSMETGDVLWSTNISRTDPNNGFVSAHAGVVLVGAGVDGVHMSNGAGGCCGDANTKVVALDAATGDVLWEYRADRPLWNFLALFGDDGTFVFQDIEGRAYRNSLKDGTNLWKAGGVKDTWTDGGALLGENGIVYTVANSQNGGFAPGVLSAFRLSDGEPLWSASVPKPPNTAPAIGRLAGKKGLSIVMPSGQQCEKGREVSVFVFDAESGEQQWTFKGYTQKGQYVSGDGEGFFERTRHGMRGMTFPNPWGAASIDANGVVFIGSETGMFVSLQDLNGDGVIEGDAALPGNEELSAFETGGSWVGSSSPALGPGMVVGADIGKVWAFVDDTLRS